MNIEKCFGIILILIASIALYIIGYNSIFNTTKHLKKIAQLANYKEGTSIYNALLSKSNFIWTKVIGFMLIIFSSFLLLSVFLKIYEHYK